MKLSAGVAGVALLLAAVPVAAHHAFASEFDANRPVTLKGTVKVAHPTRCSGAVLRRIRCRLEQ
jgi:hypothetical protein